MVTEYKKEHTFTVEFYHSANNLTLVLDVISTNDERAIYFCRQRFQLDESWIFQSVKNKYAV